MAFALRPSWPRPSSASPRCLQRPMTAMVAIKMSTSTLPSPGRVMRLAEILKQLHSHKHTENKKKDMDLPGYILSGCTVSGMLCHDARLHKHPVLAVFTTLQDEEDVSVKIKLLVSNFALPSTTEAEARMWLPTGAKVRILEPRVVVAPTMAVALLVDNPASIEIVGVDLSTDSARSTAVWKVANAAFASKDFLRAAHLYRECVARGFPEPVEAYSRSCEAWLKLGCFEKALLDADKALAPDSPRFQTLFVKAQALCGLQEYQQALECFQLAQSIASESDKAKVLDAQQRCWNLHEQSVKGVYDLSKFFLSEGKSLDSAPECSDFVGPVKISMVHGKGRGLFATERLKAGELILVSNPIGRAASREEFHASMARSCMTNRRALAQLAAFCNEEELPDVDLFRPNSNWFSNRPDHIAKPNLSYGDLIRQRLGNRNGLCPLATMVNHSCIPNVSRQYIGVSLFVRAATEIPAGEELTTCYFNPFVPRATRRAEALQREFKFVCTCRRCLTEERIEKQRPDLIKEYSRALVKPDMAKLVEVAREVDSLDDEETRQWMQTSYLNASWASVYHPGESRLQKMSKLHQLMAALHATAPGHLFTLPKMLRLAGGGAAAVGRARELLEEEAISCFGKQRPEVLDAIILSPRAAAVGQLVL